MIRDSNLQALHQTLRAAEHHQNIINKNLANANTIGYKRLEGVYGPICGCSEFEGVMQDINHHHDSAKEGLTLTLIEDKTTGRKIKLNGKEYEASNVNPTDELEKMVQVANMTRSILTGIQIENRLQQEIINLSQR